MFTSDAFWGSMGTTISGNSSSAANNAQTKLPFRLSYDYEKMSKKTRVSDFVRLYD